MIWHDRNWFISALVLLLALGLGASMLMPPTYSAMAKLLFARADLDTQTAQSIDGTDIAAEITASGARILTLANLRDIARRRPYSGSGPDDRQLDEAAVGLLENVRIDLLQSIPGKSGNTVGFTISYSNRSASVARLVVEDLVTLYLNDSNSEGARGTAVAVNLLREEELRLKEHLKTLESEIASFKEENAKNLPELNEYNLKYLAMLKQDLADLQRNIRDNQERKDQRNADLAETKPFTYIYTDDGKRLYTPGEQLELLEAKYISKALRYTPDHPDMVAMKRTIDALRRHLANPVGAVDTAQAARTADELFRSQSPVSKTATVLRSYPKVTPESEKPAASSDGDTSQPRGVRQGNGDGKASPAVAADNSVYLRLRSELESVDNKIARMEASESEIRGKILEYEKLLSRAPEVERRISEMQRAYESSSERLVYITQQEFDASMEAAIEANGAGTRFIVAEPTRVPDIPNTRKQRLLVILSVLFALAISTGLVLVRGMKKRVIYDTRSLEQLAGLRAVVAIPHMKYAHA